MKEWKRENTLHNYFKEPCYCQFDQKCQQGQLNCSLGVCWLLVRGRDMGRSIIDSEKCQYFGPYLKTFLGYNSSFLHSYLLEKKKFRVFFKLIKLIMKFFATYILSTLNIQMSDRHISFLNSHVIISQSCFCHFGYIDTYLFWKQFKHKNFATLSEFDSSTFLFWRRVMTPEGKLVKPKPSALVVDANATHIVFLHHVGLYF